MKLSHKLLSMIIAISLLLTGSILPISASVLTDDNNSPNEIVFNDDKCLQICKNTNMGKEPVFL